MQDPERQPEWVVKRHLSAEALKEYVARLKSSGPRSSGSPSTRTACSR